MPRTDAAMSYKLVGLDQAIRALGNAGGKIDVHVPIAVKKTMAVVEEKAAGKAPYDRGTLRRSIQQQSFGIKRGRVVGVVGSKLVYARIQEEGGVIRAKNKPFLVFQVGGNWVQVKQVTIPASPYMKPAAVAARPKFAKFMGAAVESSLDDVIKSARPAGI